MPEKPKDNSRSKGNPIPQNHRDSANGATQTRHTDGHHKKPQAVPKANNPAKKASTASRPAAKPAVHANRGKSTGQTPKDVSKPAVQANHSQSTSHASRSADKQIRKTPKSLGLLKMVPLGGMQEIGKNMTLYEHGEDIIIVDCGIAFPDDDMPGVDIVIPDFSYCLEHRQKIRAIFITHGHEDHIGALPWLCKELRVPVYASPLTAELIRLKLEERGTGVTGVQIRNVHDRDRVRAGCFDVEFVHVNHSIADACALAIRTPSGTVFHSGDFKIDYTPVHGESMDLSRIAAIGDDGILLLVCESTNVERKGTTPSESKVGESFAELFGKAEGRIVVTTFSSNVFRIQQVFTAAERFGRKVALVGRSMLNYFNAANALGYITMQPDTLIDSGQIDQYPRNELVLITTGSQGEPLSALSRMAYSEHRQLELIPGDTVILSSSAIPGNERSIYQMINELYRRGARVIYESLNEIHVSGHAYQEELKLLHRLIRPRYFIPAHGEFRHLYRHAELAHQLGQAWENIFLLGNGDIFEADAERARIGSFVDAGAVLVDGKSMGAADNAVLRDRRLLAEDGVITLFLAIDAASGRLVSDPDIQARGFVYESEIEAMQQECLRWLDNLQRRAQNRNQSLTDLLSSGQVKDQLRDMLYARTKRHPVILLSWLHVD